MWLYHAFPFSQELIHTSHRGTSWALCAQIVWRNAPTKSWKRCDGAVCSGSTVQPWVVKKQLTVIRLTLVSGSLLQHKLQCNLSPFYPANPMIWVWINTYKNTIFRGLFTSMLTQLFWCSPLPYDRSFPHGSDNQPLEHRFMDRSLAHPDPSLPRPEDVGSQAIGAIASGNKCG